MDAGDFDRSDENGESLSGVDPGKVLYREQSESIIGAAMKVLNTLKPGLSEKAYENSLVIELRKRGHNVEQQRRFDVLYEGIWVDTLVPDLLVDGLSKQSAERHPCKSVKSVVFHPNP